jgi:hypothetical protein
MRKTFLPFLFLSFFLIASFWAGSISAKEKAVIPERDGIYTDPDHPGIKVRVFVHNEKPAQATPPPPVQQCNLADPNSESLVSAAGWKLSPSWTYNLNLNSVPSSVGGANLIKIASDGFGQWNTPTGVSFVPGPNTIVDRQAYDGQNIIAWGRTSGTALGVTYIRYTSLGQVVDVDTIMNKKFRWSWSDSNICAWQDTYDAENILTHELGHWVGLDDEYTGEFADNTMYGYGAKGEVKKDTITNGDFSGASAIYH